MADPWEDHFQSLVPQWSPQGGGIGQPTPQAPSTQPNAQGWGPLVGREMDIAGTNFLAPIAGMARSITNLIDDPRVPGLASYMPTAETIRGLAPQPQGTAENVLAAGATGAGYALPLAALGAAGLLGGGGGSGLAAAYLRAGAAGGAVGEAMRAYNWPPWIQAGAGLAAGGMVGGSGVAGAAGPLGTMARGAGAALVGGAVDLAARHLGGLNPSLSYGVGQIADLLALGRLSGARLPVGPALTGAGTATFLGPAPGAVQQP